MKTQLELDTFCAHLNGADQIYSRTLFSKKCYYTNNVKHVIESSSMNWFLNDFFIVVNMKDQLKMQRFLTAVLEKKESTAIMKITDGNDNVLCTQKYGYTDMPFDSIKLFYELSYVDGASNMVLMFPTER